MIDQWLFFSIERSSFFEYNYNFSSLFNASSYKSLPYTYPLKNDILLISKKEFKAWHQTKTAYHFPSTILTTDVSQVSRFLGSSNNFELNLKKFISINIP